MTTIKPFRAVRPVRDKVHLVATRPYYCYKKSVLKAKLKSNPYTFLQIINPNYDLLEVNSDKEQENNRLNLVKNKYNQYINEGVLVQDETETLYVYRQSHLNFSYTGIIAAASVQDYTDGNIKKHEATLTSRETLFTNYLDVVGYNAEPVLLSYQHDDKIENLINQVCSNRPEYEFTTTDEIKHELWLMSPIQAEACVDFFHKIDATYIADGHHRIASSALLNSKRTANGNPSSDASYFLSFLIDEEKLKIFEYNRLVRNTTNLTVLNFLDEVGKHFTVLPLEAHQKPSKEHEMNMYVNNTWYRLECKPEIIESNHPIRSLDAEILTNYVLTPILGIHDLKTDKNIGFTAGTVTLDKMIRKMKKQHFDIAFELFPVRMDQIKKVADNEMIMPPKSTWIEPKLRSGLTIYKINE
jgi:uncharacterized protein (DUF1015 family)